MTLLSFNQPLGNKKKFLAQNDAGELIVAGAVSDGSSGSGIGSKTININHYGTLGPQSGEVEVYNSLDEPVILDYLEIATGSLSDVQFRIYLGSGGSSSQRIKLLRNDGITIDSITAQNLADSASGLFDVVWYDEQYNSFKFALNRELICVTGLRISVLNTSVDSERCGVIGFGRLL